MNKNILIGIMGLFILASAAFVSAGTNTGSHYYWVTNNDDQSQYYVRIIAAQNTSSELGGCTDSDLGVKPATQGSIDAFTVSPTGHRVLGDKVNAVNGVVREFACGSDITIQGAQYPITWAFAMIYDPNAQPPLP